jgi:hypothetical protein
MLQCERLAQYWKLPAGFIRGDSLPDSKKIGRVVESCSTGRVRRVTANGGSIFCSTDEEESRWVGEPKLYLRDAETDGIAAQITQNPPDEIVFPFRIQSQFELFQFEDYAALSRQSRWLQYARRLYYLIRPSIPRILQIAFRQSIAPLQSRKSFPNWPLDVSLDVFARTVLRLILDTRGISEIPFIWFWPEGCSSAVVLSHDVETQLGHDSLWAMANLEIKHGFRSSWNFVPERYKVDPELLSDLSSAGFEIGVHGLCHDGRLFDTYTLFKRRALRINDYLAKWHSEGFRAPSAIRNLRWIAERISAEYDTSCPTTEIHAPQPGGCCTVFPFMIDQMVEIPFTMPQDHALFVILGNQLKEPEAVWEQVGARILEQNGMVSTIVHPDYMTGAKNLARYERLLVWLKDHSLGTWLALPREVAAWWKARNKQQLVHDGTKWQVVGPQATRARIARISCSDDALVFSQQV